MARVTVGPTPGGGWHVTGENSAFKTQRDAVAAPADSRKARLAASS